MKNKEFLDKSIEEDYKTIAILLTVAFIGSVAMLAGVFYAILH